MPSDLPPQLARLLNALPESGADAPIIMLYREVFQDHDTPEDELRVAQQKLGSYISRLNRRLKGARRRVVPGVARHTYRLVATR